MSITKKSIIDDVQILLTKFAMTDDTALDEDYISYKIDQIRSELIIDKYNKELETDPSWLQDLGIVAFHKVNTADDSSQIACNCTMSKTFLPQIVSLSYGNGMQDIGLYNVMSTCGKTRYYPLEMMKWMYIPENHVMGKFHYYSRVNNALYVNKDVEGLRILAILQNPEDGFIKNSQPILSGSIVSGTQYIVKFDQVVYNGVTYQPNTTFTGTATAGTATANFFTSNGVVYLKNQVEQFNELQPYPISGDMARKIVLEVLTKEFRIEMSAIIDVQNDSKDDVQKQQS